MHDAGCPVEELSLFTLIGNGDGTFQPPIANDAVSGSSLVVVGDFDGDGVADVALDHRYPGGAPRLPVVSVLRGTGDGTFGPPLRNDLVHVVQGNLSCRLTTCLFFPDVTTLLSLDRLYLAYCYRSPCGY